MELDSPDPVQVTQKSEETLARFVIPELEFVIVAATDHQANRLITNQIHAPHCQERMMNDSHDQLVGLVVPYLNDYIDQGRHQIGFRGILVKGQSPATDLVDSNDDSVAASEWAPPEAAAVAEAAVMYILYLQSCAV